jgi:hypothetical protein
LAAIGPQLYQGYAFKKYNGGLEEEFQKMKESSESFYTAIIKHP